MTYLDDDQPEHPVIRLGLRAQLHLVVDPGLFAGVDVEERTIDRYPGSWHCALGVRVILAEIVSSITCR